ncbi:hypothetical protein BPC006_II1568 [Burkholderia pseudomallei BPC006]|nr:hypothetical protein BPC006_II1568 [Burkholderia pseudomallei BPC006]
MRDEIEFRLLNSLNYFAKSITWPLRISNCKN